MIQKLKARLANLVRQASREAHERKLDAIYYHTGLVKAMIYEEREFDDPKKAGYSVYSQFGEDGIIQYLLRKVPIQNDLFIEIGVEDYTESNTRFLLQKDNWRGVLVDCVDDAKRFLRDSGLYGGRTVELIQAFLTQENIDEILAPYAGDIGLLSIDVDGVDYFLWEALTVVSPRIVVIEYQSNWGPTETISTPYRPDFNRTKHHYTNLAFGASLAALTHLADRKGYALVGSSEGHNAFFVRRDVLGSLPERTVQDTYSEMRYRDSRDPQFRLTFLTTMEERRRAMRDALVVDVITGQTRTVGDVFGL
jgi:hypothetical protein